VTGLGEWLKPVSMPWVLLPELDCAELPTVWVVDLPFRLWLLVPVEW